LLRQIEDPARRVLRPAIGETRDVPRLAESAGKTAAETREAFNGLASSIENVAGCVDRTA
jgi:hypothetical protein